MKSVLVVILLLTALTGEAAPLQVPPHHPYLALTPDDIARAKERVANFPWAKRSLAALTAEADKIIAQPADKLPARGDQAHWKRSGQLFNAAAAFSLTGTRRYADWVRDGLLAYADMYPGLPLTRGRCRVFTQSSLYEALWLVPLVQAYDLVAESGAFTPAQREHIERDLLSTAVACFKVDDFERDPRIKDLHYRCYNFQAWHLSAVGLVGLVLNDPGLVDYAINSRYGFNHLVAHDMGDDGLFWERSPGYHGFVVAALAPLVEALAHCGVDLYQQTVPTDRSHDESVHYMTDTSDKPKSLRLMFDAPFYLAFPDFSFPALGDSDPGIRHAEWIHLAAWQHYRDPKLAWLLRRDAPVGMEEATHGRVGFLHYYRYQYRHENVRLNGRPVTWARRDTTYEPQGCAVVVSDGGRSQPDRYLLNDADTADFTLEWTTTRLADSGKEDRAWVVFHADAKKPQGHKSFPLAGCMRELNRPYTFRLEAAGHQTTLFCDGRKVSSTPTIDHYTPDWHWLLHDLPDACDSLKLEETFANTGVYRNGCSLFPSSGVAMLRQTAGDFTARPEATAVAFSYGPYGGGHGHPDKLSVAVYAHGRQWIPLFGSMPYETHWKQEWTAQTVSHNTMVVDGVSQKPTRLGKPMWPVDSATNRVVGRLETFDPEQKQVSASCDSVYDGLVLRRTVRLRGNCVVDRYEVSPADRASPLTHQFDYILHLGGEPAGSSVALSPCQGPLGTQCGYPLIEQKEKATIRGVVSFTFASEGKQLRVWVVPAEDTPIEVIAASGLTNSPDVRMPMLVLRQRGTKAKFITVIEPVDPASPVQAVRLERGEPVIERGPASGAAKN